MGFTMRPMGFPLEWELKNVAQNRNEVQMGINVMGMAVAFSQSHSYSDHIVSNSQLLCM